MRNDLIISLPDLSKAREKNPNGASFHNIELNINHRLKDFARGKSYYIRTYGCQANMRDSESLAGILSMVGFTCTEEPKGADVIVVNTCSVREKAEDKVFGEIGTLKHYSKDCILCVCGCMVERPEITDELLKKYRYVDIVFGTHEVSFFLDYLTKVALKEKERVISVNSKAGDIYEGLPCVRGNRHKAFVNISYGCDKFCTYCIVPYTRGRERSRRMVDILNEVQELKNNGYQEVTLLGQNVNSYGKDLTDGSSFALLLEEVAKIGIPRVRFLTSYPSDFNSDVIDVIAKYPNIMKYIHLPLQAGSDHTLKMMCRRYTKESYLKLVKEMKSKIKDLFLTTDIIVGFPKETEEDFNETLEMIKEVGYDCAFTFIYSPRPGTPAAKMEDQIPDEVKHARFDRLKALIDEMSAKSADAMVGNTYKVLVDGISKSNDEMLSGYTEGFKLVHFKGDVSLIGKIVNVKINESHTYSLLGELVDE